MDELQREYDRFASDVEKFGNQKKELEAKLLALTEQQRVMVEKKNQLNKLFYHKYSRFIQEGSWIDENYMDDNLYYLDGLAVARTSSKPKITYDIGVVDLSAAVEYEEDRQVLENEIGDRTYVEDTEFFGY
jgi:chromosome segregation ATPase